MSQIFGQRFIIFKTWRYRSQLLLKLRDVKGATLFHWISSGLTCLRALRVFAPYVPSRLMCLRALRAFAPYAPSCLRALRTFVPYVLWFLRALIMRLARLIYVNYAINRIYEKTFRSDLSTQKKHLFWRITYCQLLFVAIYSYLVTLIDFFMIISFIGHFC